MWNEVRGEDPTRRSRENNKRRNRRTNGQTGFGTYAFLAPAACRACLGTSRNTDHGGRWLFTQSAARGTALRRGEGGTSEGGDEVRSW